jgi:hypothetical protein
MRSTAGLHSFVFLAQLVFPQLIGCRLCRLEVLFVLDYIVFVRTLFLRRSTRRNFKIFSMN